KRRIPVHEIAMPSRSSHAWRLLDQGRFRRNQTCQERISDAMGSFLTLHSRWREVRMARRAARAGCFSSSRLPEVHAKLLARSQQLLKDFSNLSSVRLCP